MLVLKISFFLNLDKPKSKSEEDENPESPVNGPGNGKI